MLQERIKDPEFRRAVHLMDLGDVNELREHLQAHPDLVLRRVNFDGRGYFSNPSLLEFAAENPIRHGTLPRNIEEVARVIVEAGGKADQPSLDSTLGLVSSGCVPRECGVQVPLIHLLCDYGADPDKAMLPALTHGEFQAVDALLARGATITLPVAAATGRLEDARRLLTSSSPEARHVALAFAAQNGHIESALLLLDAGEDPSRYNPSGCHAHSTPLHQAVVYGHLAVVRLLVERGASLDVKDLIYEGTPLGWAIYAKHAKIEEYLRSVAAPRGS